MIDGPMIQLKSWFSKLALLKSYVIEFSHSFLSKKMTLNMKNSSNNPRNMLTSSDSKFRKIIEEFCQLTSLHGFSFMYKSNKITVRMIWILAIISVIGVGVFFLIGNTEAYIQSRLVTNIESSTANLSVSTNQI